MGGDGQWVKRSDVPVACPHKNMTLVRVMVAGVVVSSEMVCDDCGFVLSG